MITTGAQIRAARALLDWSRPELAAAAELSRNAVAYWENHPTIPAGHHRTPYAIGRIQRALLAAGVEPIVDPAPGVCFLARSPKRKARMHSEQVDCGMAAAGV